MSRDLAVTEMSTYFRRGIVAVLAGSLLGAGSAGGQESQALFLPRDGQRIDEMTVTGTRERRLPSGLTRLTVPDSATTYYVIDEVNAARGDLFDAFADISRNDSDISIGYDQLRSDFVHLRIRESARDVRHIRMEPALLFQLSEFFRAGGYANGPGSIKFVEYQSPIADCPGLDAAIDRMEALLLDSVSNIGAPLEPADVLVVDGIGYRMTRAAGLSSDISDRSRRVTGKDRAVVHSS